MNKHQTNSRNRLIILSPLLVGIVTYGTAQLAAPLLGEWTWVSVIMVYWGMIAGLLTLGKQAAPVRNLIQPATGPRGWTVLALAVGLIPLPILLLNLGLLADPVIFVCWLAFALINPWFEELYWRGLLAAVTAHWPPTMSWLYATFFFVAFHPFVLGVFSIANRSWMPVVSLVLMSAAWAAAYRKTGTLRWAIVSHALVDLGNLAVPVLMNLYIPPPLG